MLSIISLDHEIVQLPDAVGVLWVGQTSQRNWVTIKVHYGHLRKRLLGWRISRLGFVTRLSERYLWALSVMHITISLASIVTNELVAG